MTENKTKRPKIAIIGGGRNAGRTLKAHIDLLEELEQYRAIGTIEDFKRAKAMENVYGQVKWERDVAISQLEEIGISLGQKMDEFKALKEKAEAKKPILNNPKIDEFYIKEAKLCPACHSYINNCSGDYCRDCGQKLDWTE